MTLSKYTEYLKTLLLQKANITSIVDALDECASPKDFLGVMKELQTTLSCKAAESITNVSLSSRDEAEVEEIFPDCLPLGISPDDTKDDLSDYIQTEIRKELGHDKYHPLKEDNALHTRTVNTLGKHSKGARVSPITLALP